MPRKKKPTRRYGDYTEIIRGELYAAVTLPLGGGKYKKKRKKVDTVKEASQWAERELERHRMGERSMTFTELSDWYKLEYLVEPVYQQGKKLYGVRTWKWQRTTLDRLNKLFGHLLLDEITVDILRRHKRDRLKTVSISAVNREFALMRTMLKRAQARRWIRENPFDKGERLIEVSLEHKRSVQITRRVAVRLLARSRESEQPLLHYLILVLMCTGARPSEVYPYQDRGDSPKEPLVWSAILDHDFKAVRLVSYKGRIRSERLVPASSALERGLRELYSKVRPKPSDLVFPVKSFKRSWATLLKSLKLEGYVLRDFRRYYNTFLVNSGMDEVSRMMILGHKEVLTNLRYSLIDENFIKRYREAVK